jgi:cytochrome bd-type quinol oxidase subunit 2
MLSLYNHIIVQVLVVICIGLSFKSLPASTANVMRKIVGFGCIILAIVAAFFFIQIGMNEMSYLKIFPKTFEMLLKSDMSASSASKNATSLLTTNRIQWTILITIFLPIMYGLGIYGYRAFRGAFDNMEQY